MNPTKNLVLGCVLFIGCLLVLEFLVGFLWGILLIFVPAAIEFEGVFSLILGIPYLIFAGWLYFQLSMRIIKCGSRAHYKRYNIILLIYELLYFTLNMLLFQQPAGLGWLFGIMLIYNIFSNDPYCYWGSKPLAKAYKEYIGENQPQPAREGQSEPEKPIIQKQAPPQTAERVGDSWYTLYKDEEFKEPKEEILSGRAAQELLKKRGIFEKKGYSIMMTAIALILAISFSLYGVYAYGEMTDKNVTIAKQSKQINVLKAQKNAYRSGYNEYKNQYQRLDNMYTFYIDHAVVVASGSNVYHRYGCSKLDTSHFYIYNTEAAISRGYRECPDCLPRYSWADAVERANVNDAIRAANKLRF